MRKRIACPGLFENLTLGSGSPFLLPLFLGLTMIADREGRFKWRPAVIHGSIFPHRSDKETRTSELLDCLAKSGMIKRYQVDGQSYGYIPNFAKYQNIHKHEARSNIPDPTMYLHSSDNESTMSVECTESVSLFLSTDLNKKDLKIKKEDPALAVPKRTERAPHVFLSDDELENVRTKLGDLTDTAIEYFSNWQLEDESGKRIRDNARRNHALCLVRWVGKAISRDGGAPASFNRTSWAEQRAQYQAGLPERVAPAVAEMESALRAAERAKGAVGRISNPKR